MYIGSRCHSTEKQIEDFIRNAGKYVDVFSMNQETPASMSMSFP